MAGSPPRNPRNNSNQSGPCSYCSNSGNDPPILVCFKSLFLMILIGATLRAASMARKIYLRGGLGVGGLRGIYGGSQRNWTRHPHFCKSSGSVARNILQQLQVVGIVEMEPRGVQQPKENHFQWTKGS